MALLEGTLNAINCPSCQNKINLSAPLAAANPDLKAMIAVVPDSLRSWTERELEKAGAEWDVTYCKDYGELYLAMAPWINSTVSPVLHEILSSTIVDRPLDEQITRLSPLLLRILKSQIDGRLLEEMIKLGGDADKEEKKEWLKSVHNAIVVHLIQQLVYAAIGSREVPQLDQTLRTQVPAVCVTPEVLSEKIGNCIDLKNPAEDPTSFRKGFLREYVNASLHAHAGKINPRGKNWAEYLFAIWLLSKDEEVTLDAQFKLSNETIRNTVRFRDLWNVAVAGISLEQQNEFKEQFATGTKMMEDLGFQEELEDMFEAAPIRMRIERGTKLPPEKLGNSFIETILKQYSFNESIDKSVGIGEIVGGSVNNLIRNGQRDAAMFVAEEMLRRAFAAEDYFAAASIGTQLVKTMNLAEEYYFAGQIASELLGLAQDKTISVKLASSRPSLMRDLFNESGNVSRYMHQYEMALTAYDLAEKMEGLIPEEDRNPDNLAVLRRNRAIVLRNMGQYRKAKEILDAELTQRPTDHLLLYSRVQIDFQTNNYKKALSYLDRAIELTEQVADLSVRSEYLLTRGLIKKAMGSEAAGIDDLINAYQLSEAESSLRVLRIAAAAMRFHSEQSEHREFIENCLRIQVEALASKEHRSNLSLILTMGLSIAQRYLEEGKPEELPEAVHTELDWLDSLEASVPWHFDFIRGWLAYHSGDLSSCWEKFQLACAAFETSVPGGVDVSFAPSWMLDKEQFQQVVTSVGLELIDQEVLEPKEAIRFYEFTNGREITSRFGTSLSVDTIRDLIRTYAANLGRPVEVFFPIAAGNAIRICRVPSTVDQPIAISDVSWNKHEVRAVRDQTAWALKLANPADLTWFDEQTSGWNELGSQLGRFFDAYLQPDCHVCFLPGRDLTGLPLHLSLMPDGRRLIEKTTVTFAPNFATLLATQKGANANTPAVGIVTVTKRRDSEKFRNRALKASAELHKILAPSYRISELVERDGKRKDVLDLLEQSDKMFFICHGAYAGASRGFGICVADEHQLPPSLFPIDEIPELKRFVITWDDFEDIQSCPSLVVTIACSSGITQVGPGGTRHGLEQTLFAKGTRALISPIWDIDQEAGLEWLKTFCQLQTQHPEKGYEVLYRDTCLTVKERLPHLFFWGAFTLNGSLFAGG
jgi:tetratricopeptide (TPR) repeat protein/CHAT domain-containing protein